MDQGQRIITIKEARKLLGKAYTTVSDAQVESIINDLEFMAEITLKHLKKSVPKSTLGAFQHKQNKR